MFLAKIYVQLKPTVNDPEGQTIMSGLHSLSFKTVSDVRYGKYMEVKLEESQRSVAEEQVHSMCRQLLANLVIEDYRFDLEEVPEPKSALSA